MNDEYEEPNGLLDDDPALDCILFEEMKRESTRPGNHPGCLGMVALFILPIAGIYFVAQLL
ncbi:hypothetical protein [Desulfobulbus oligotrophicus]|uniref:Uncharacterized protein n=1 Tax=Desulfobulbus oligotrophicus TaxID=1909699 RepID=A0A7T6APF3_9BACT|nr:hypothetical protein [Desulfobulbus oligotrophicus]QQG64641.1 hypothetical protein HP555_01570 [Desulfobulbus oligotrophicus]